MWRLRLPGERLWLDTGRVSSGRPESWGWGPEIRDQRVWMRAVGGT